jgi:hypothetical protein
LSCVAALVLTGCASKGASHSGYQPPPAHHVATLPKPEVEDDGREAQPAAPRHLKAIPDDPTQPWSPNYGGPKTAPARMTPAAPRTASIPDDLPPDFRKRLVTKAD